MMIGSRAFAWLLAGALGAAAIGAGCLYDAAKRCGDGATLNASEVCVCAPGHVPVYRDINILQPSTPTEKPPFSSCRPCGEHEVPSGDQCACAVGYVRKATGCEPSNLGATCAADADCASGDATYCQLPAGYCTSKGCAGNADCNTAADYACATTATPPYCKRPPVGQGGACTMLGPDPACATEAPICVLGGCAPMGCKTDGDCSPSRHCCDFTKFGQPGVTLCLGSCP